MECGIRKDHDSGPLLKVLWLAENCFGSTLNQVCHVVNMGDMIVSSQRTYLISEAAEIVGKCPSRLRQICIEKNIGMLRTPRLRELTEEDLTLLQNIPDMRFKENQKKLQKKNVKRRKST